MGQILHGSARRRTAGASHVAGRRGWSHLWPAIVIIVSTSPPRFRTRCCSRERATLRIASSSSPLRSGSLRWLFWSFIAADGAGGICRGADCPIDQRSRQMGRQLFGAFLLRRHRRRYRHHRWCRRRERSRRRPRDVAQLPSSGHGGAGAGSGRRRDRGAIPAPRPGSGVTVGANHVAGRGPTSGRPSSSLWWCCWRSTRSRRISTASPSSATL
jgi:hypothetical protein